MHLFLHTNEKCRKISINIVTGKTKLRQTFGGLLLFGEGVEEKISTCGHWSAK